MSFATYFKASSYTMIAVAMLALVLAGGLHIALALIFAGFMVLAWNLEGRRWQLSERVGLVIVLISVPLFFLDWKYQRVTGEAPGRLGVDALAHLIVFLSTIKLLQVKSDRDWVFLYLISFFEVLLAAGLSFSPVFLFTLSLYLLCALSTVIAFEIRKAQRGVKLAETRLLVTPDSKVFKRLAGNPRQRRIEASRLPLVAVSLLFLIFVLALPLFLVAPRAGSAAITRGGGGLTNFIGFSESVTLGEVGTLKQNDEIVMRVRIEEAQPERNPDLKWRGVALDEFTGRGWKKSAEARKSKQELLERGFFRLGTTEALQRLTTQTVFLEPIDSSVLFAASRAVAIQGDFPYVRLDNEGSIQTRPHELDRIIYKVVSDTSSPDTDALRRDMRPYAAAYERYKQVPALLDPRIAELARTTVINAGARNRYDAAKAVESHLRTDYGYSLRMRASGPDPLADFLFNIRAGHCEYFSTAMAVMLRRLGIATRVVNGFLPGEYNEAAGAYTVRQSDAHSWVEVYFPETNSWVTFDPTPAAGRIEPLSTGFVSRLGKYAEALELIWFQYVVGYDKQEQRSLAISFNNRLSDFRRLLENAFAALSRTVSPSAGSILLVIAIIGILPLILVIASRVQRFGWRRALTFSSSEPDTTATAIEFYERLLAALAARGIKRSLDQTPTELAASCNLSAAITITHAYNRVRFGRERLSTSEVKEIERSLADLEATAN